MDDDRVRIAKPGTLAFALDQARCITETPDNYVMLRALIATLTNLLEGQ